MFNFKKYAINFRHKAYSKLIKVFINFNNFKYLYDMAIINLSLTLCQILQGKA